MWNVKDGSRYGWIEASVEVVAIWAVERKFDVSVSDQGRRVRLSDGQLEGDIYGKCYRAWDDHWS